jgi:Ca2+-binding EF-hand superfamily protein
MSFFGLTQLGVQDTFKVNLVDGLDINIFDDEEFADAFDELDIDNNGFIDIDEMRSLLTKIFRGAPPEKEVKRFMAFFDTNQDGRVTKEEFRTGLVSMKQQASEEASNTSTKEFTSGEEYRAKLKKHTRMSAEPVGKYAAPQTTAMANGWAPEDAEAKVGERMPKQSCAETIYADAMVKSGVYF